MTGRRIFGRDLSFAECCLMLQGMNFLNVVIRLTMLLRYNDEKIMSMEVEDSERDRRTAWILRQFLGTGSESERALDEWAKVRSQGQHYRPFSSPAILALLEFAGANCQRNGGANVEQEPQRSQLAHVLVSIQAELISRLGQTQIMPGMTTADASRIIHPELIRNRMAHNAERYRRNALGRIYAIGFVPEIAAQLRPGLTPSGFFQNRLGLAPGQYLVAAVLTGLFQGRYDPDAPNFANTAVKPPELFAHVQQTLRGRLEEYIALASQPADRLGSGIASVTTLGNLIYEATSFYVKPILKFDGFSVCTSSVHLTNKFLVGLVHLVQDRARVASGGALSDSFVQTVGGEFGELFEAYLRWLFTQWFGSWPRTRLYFGYRIPPVGNGPTDPERDILVVRGEIAFVFEIKSKPVPLSLRRSGAQKYLDAVFLPAALQARTAAEAIRAGTATTSSGTPISGIRFVIPCAIVWDFIPMAGALSKDYEHHLRDLVSPTVFREEDGIAPLQFLSLEDVEGWERNCDLTPESGDLFGFLVRRAREEALRYSPMQPDNFRGAQAGQPRPLEDKAAESHRYTKEETWRYLDVPPPSSETGAPGQPPAAP
jgi:hypothetical protein